VTIGAFLLILAIIVVLVALANRIRVAFPIVLVLGGMVLGYLPGFPVIVMPPELVLVVFLPPLLYWESVTAPTSEFRSSAWWILQMAVGLVIVTTCAVAVVAHWLEPALGWAAAFVLGAVVSSTDEVAFAPIVERLPLPRHVVASIEGEALVNDATSLVLYAVAVAAVVTGTFSVAQAIGDLARAVVEAIAIGIAAGSIAVLAWRFIKEDALQAVISISTPYLAYLPAQHLGASAVLAVVTAGLFVNRFTPTVLTPSARERATGFWGTITFVANALIFVLVGIQFRPVVESLAQYSVPSLIWYGVAVSAVVIIVRLVWTFGQALLPITNEPEHVGGKADWSHVWLLSWAGMRGGVSIAAALAIPFETAAGPFPGRNLIIFLTFCVLLATLVGQAGTMPLLIRWLHIEDDGAGKLEERLALAAMARAALTRIDKLDSSGELTKDMCDFLRVRFEKRWQEFKRTDAAEAATKGDAAEGAAATALYRKASADLVDAQRTKLIALRDKGKIDNTVMRRLQRLLDLESEEIALLGSAGHSELDAVDPEDASA
jgi:monovalent cation/hydrogen antiporter